MEKLQQLHLGAAYHGNRMLSHVRDDMRNMVQNGMDTVIHMFSHNDVDRHKNIMKEIFHISMEYGLDVWVDNWGLGGPPGDKSHFLSYYPGAHQVYSNGDIAPVHVCYNAPEFVQFTKDWIDIVGEAGAKKLFWDEPHLLHDKADGDKPERFTCCCPRCKKLFEEKYGKPMPTVLTPEVEEFRTWSIANYFKTVSDYAKANGMYNSICVMLGASGISLENMASICGIESLDNIGSDPYWLDLHKGYEDVYKYVYEKSKFNMDVCEHFKKDHNLWIQGYRNPIGREEEIIASADAIYDSGARTIFVWGYRGSEGVDYRAESPDASWAATCQAMLRLRERDRDERRAAIRAEMGLK